MKQDFELLAPAGSFEILKAVIEAGADAVYVGGSHFGARAYANNFSEEELPKAIDYVHLRGKKLFLTVNTLFKNQEIDNSLYEYLLPYYEKGLDAVIVQDFGAVAFIKEHFPALSIHTSTQMTVTGVEGAKLLKEFGAERVVLARELSIAEMKRIKEEAGVELEAFVHGALCYSYSGQCLFSSLLGGRSGNRGRCAQPCRLPYAVLNEEKKEYKKESYVLSLKDLCGIEYLQKLREAGVYSLKIEGRMKQASYAAGVVSFYRKYIDLEKQVSKEDMKHLYDLGNRCGFTTEYFEKQNDKSMITFDKPSYEKFNDALHQEIEKKYVGGKHQIPATATFILQKGQALEAYGNAGEHHVYVSLGEVQEAQNKPLELSEVKERLNKTGDSSFYFETVEVHMDEDIFVPNGVLNQLRREVLNQLEEEILKVFRRDALDKEKLLAVKEEMISKDTSEKIICSCETREQLSEILKRDFVTTIYLDAQKYNRKTFVADFYQDVEAVSESQKEVFLKLPAIFRTTTSNYYTNIAEEVKLQFNYDKISGFVVRNFEELYFVKKHFPEKQIVIDHNLYTYNNYAKEGFGGYDILRDTMPLELNQKEIRRRDNRDSEMLIYGYYPLMTSAGCVHKNTLNCDKNPQISYLKDRYQVLFPVKNYCNDCYNVIYNSLPTLLFGERDVLQSYGVKHFRLDFSVETGKETANVLNLFQGIGNGIESTKGHYKRGVE